MRRLGIPENELSIQNAMCVALVQQALNGWGGKIRTYASTGQSRLPYRLATPQYFLRYLIG